MMFLCVMWKARGPKKHQILFAKHPCDSVFEKVMAASTYPSCNTLGGFVSTALSVVDERVQTGTVEPELTAPWPKPKSEHTRTRL